MYYVSSNTNPHRRRVLGRQVRRCEENIKAEVRQIWFDYVSELK
jgi:hypothetical protein